MLKKAETLVEWGIPFSLVGAIIVGTGWVLLFG